MFYPWRRSLSPSELRKVNRKRQPRRARRNRFVLYLERLESRDCPSTIFNLSKMLDNQSDATIAINPANPQQMFVASTSFHGGYDGGTYYAGGSDPPLTNGLFFGYSSNGGTSWTTDVMATGTDLGTDDHEPGYGLPAAGHFPHAAFDRYGNLFLTYVADRVEFRGVGAVVFNGNTGTLTDSAAHWFPNEWTNSIHNTLSIMGVNGSGGTTYTIQSNTTNTLTFNGPPPIQSSTYYYEIWTTGYSWFQSIEVVQSIDGGTFSHQLDYPSQQNFTLLTSLIGFPGNPPGPVIPMVATGPGFNGNAFAGLSTGSNSTTTLNDTRQSWSTNFANELVTITEGTGQGQTRTIASNTGTQLTVTSAWSTIPDATSSFEIAPLTGTSTGGNSSTTLNDTNQNWITNQVATELVRIISGTGAGQTRSIASNTATQLTVTSAWSTIPDATSKYEVAPVSGTSTTGDTATTLNDTNQSWTSNFYAGDIVVLSEGTGTQQATVITANSTTQLTVSPAWGVVPDTTSSYLLGPKFGSVWVGYKGYKVPNMLPAAIGAATYDLGLGAFGIATKHVTSFYPAITISSQETMHLTVSGLAVGPGGQVLTSWVNQPQSGQAQVKTAEAGGLMAQQFTAPTVAANTYMGVDYGSILALGKGTLTPMAVDAAPQLAYDTDPSSSHYGRAYLVYTNSAGAGSDNTDIFAMYSDNNGLSSWTTGNSGKSVDDDGGTNSQFWPQAAVDPTTGKLAVTWYDARNDPGNVKVQVYDAVSSDGAGSFATNQQITAGQTNGAIANLESSGTITSVLSTSMTDSNQLWTTTNFPAGAGMDWWQAWTPYGFTSPQPLFSVTAVIPGNPAISTTAGIVDNHTSTSLSLQSSGWSNGLPAAGDTYSLGVTVVRGTTGPEGLGRYTGLAFYNGQLWPAWADNSNSTGDNPNRNKNTSNTNVWQLNIYTVGLTVGGSSPSPAAALVSGPAISEPLTSRPEEAARNILLASIVQPTDALATSTQSATADPAPPAAEQARINAVQPLFDSLKPDDHPLHVLRSKSASPGGSNLAELSIWETGIALDL